MSSDIDPVKDAMSTGLHACGFGPLNAELCRAHIMRALTAANLLLVPRAVVEEAYRDGFESGSDHNNLGYKYPPIEIAWRISDTRKKITGEHWRLGERYAWDVHGDDPNRACIPAAADKQGAG